MGLLPVTTATQLQLVNVSNETVKKNIRNREKSFTEDKGQRGIGLTWGTIPAIVHTDENQRYYNNKPTEKIWNGDVQNTNQDSSFSTMAYVELLLLTWSPPIKKVHHSSQIPYHNFCFG